MNRLHSWVMNDRDDEVTSIDHRFRRLTLPSSDTELVDVVDLRSGNRPMEEDDTVLRDDGVHPEGARFGLRQRIEQKSLGVVLALSCLVCIFAVLAYREHQTVCLLREAITEMTPMGMGMRVEDAYEPGPDTRTPRVERERPFSVHAETEPSNRAALERQGADLLAANDFEGALAHYRALTEQFRNDPVFADMVTVLERKQGCNGSESRIEETCP